MKKQKISCSDVLEGPGDGMQNFEVGQHLESPLLTGPCYVQPAIGSSPLACHWGLPCPPQVAPCGSSGVSHLIIMGKVKVILGEKAN